MIVQLACGELIDRKRKKGGADWGFPKHQRRETALPRRS